MSFRPVPIALAVALFFAPIGVLGGDYPRILPEAAARAALNLPDESGPEEIIPLALEFSGASAAERAAAAKGLEKLLGRMRGESWMSPDAGASSIGDSVLLFLHEHLFQRYDEAQTKIPDLMTTGVYNCVSSAVVYLIFAGAAGLEVAGVRTDDHAFCRVSVDGRWVDVETTSPYGFDPGTRKEFTDDFGATTGYAYVPPSSYGGRREIGASGLLALILYNRASFDSDAGLFAEAVPSAVDAHAVLQDKDSSSRLSVVLSNYAKMLVFGGRDDDAMEFLDLSAEAYGFEAIAALRSDVVYNYALRLIGLSRYEEALRILDDRRALGHIAEDRWKAVSEHVYLRWASETADPLAAAARALLGIERVGRSRDLLRAYEVFVHNHVVSLVRQDRPDAAMEVLRDALRIHAESDLLATDLSALGRDTRETD